MILMLAHFNRSHTILDRHHSGLIAGLHRLHKMLNHRQVPGALTLDRGLFAIRCEL